MLFVCVQSLNTSVMLNFTHQDHGHFGAMGWHLAERDVVCDLSTWNCELYLCNILILSQQRKQLLGLVLTFHR